MEKFTFDQMEFILHPEVRLINISSYKEDIEWAGTRSTQKSPEELKEGFVKRIVERKHLSLGRFASAHFEINCSRVTEAQLLRHKFLEFCIQSGRYTKYNPEFILPATIKNPEHRFRYKNSCFNSYDNYLYLLEADVGVKKEDARYLLPPAIIVNIAVTGNFQAWYDFLRLRLNKKAQWEIREIAEKIRDKLVVVAKEFFFDFKK
ncbi:MAG: FAD-dependent thymidylate synthase [Candidatus Paceibacterota bacterium]|jgi:thymidylate synthase (FAD)